GGQRLAHAERVVDVHLAAKGVDEVALHGWVPETGPDTRDHPAESMGGRSGSNANAAQGAAATSTPRNASPVFRSVRARLSAAGVPSGGAPGRASQVFPGATDFPRRSGA